MGEVWPEGDIKLHRNAIDPRGFVGIHELESGVKFSGGEGAIKIHCLSRGNRGMELVEEALLLIG